MIAGGDGFCGWPTALRLSAAGHDVAIVDNLSRRAWDEELGAASLTALAEPAERIEAWRELTGRRLEWLAGDLCDGEFIRDALAAFEPEGLVHFAEQSSAPYSMMDREHAVSTQTNNVVGTLNLLFAIRDVVPDCHLVKLGTMGEYGTPNIDIEEGYLEVEHKGRRDRLPFPKQPGSFYHLSKVHDSHNIMFACRAWGLHATDLNQGVVYNVETPETAAEPQLVNRYDYDSVFGTVLNRFCVQAVLGEGLTVYGEGGQTRGFIDLRDTVACVELALRHPAPPGELRVFNQFTEQWSVAQLAERVVSVACGLGHDTEIVHWPNPRVEAERHHYRAAHSGLPALGLEPHLLNDETIARLLEIAGERREYVRPETIPPDISWREGRCDEATAGVGQPAGAEIGLP